LQPAGQLPRARRAAVQRRRPAAVAAAQGVLGPVPQPVRDHVPVQAHLHHVPGRLRTHVTLPFTALAGPTPSAVRPSPGPPAAPRSTEAIASRAIRSANSFSPASAPSSPAWKPDFSATSSSSRVATRPPAPPLPSPLAPAVNTRSGTSGCLL